MITGFARTDAVLSARAVHWHPRRTGHGDAESAAAEPRRPAVGHDSGGARGGYRLPRARAYYLAGLALLLAKLGEPPTNLLAILGFNLIMFALVELPPIGLS